MRMLVTGASGYIGSRLIPLLLEHGHQVKVLTRDPAALDALPWRDDVSVSQGDLTNPESLETPCRDQDLILHCAGFAHAGAGNEERHWRINGEGSVALLDAARRAGAKRFLMISSIKASDPARDDAYGRAKAMAEARLLESHRRGELSACSLRPTAVYGPGMKGSLAGWIRLIDRRRVPPLPPVPTRHAMIGVEDLCRAVRLAAETDFAWGRTWTLSDGQAYPVNEIERRIRLALGRKVPRLYLPRAGWYLAARLSDLLRRGAGIDAGFGINRYNVLFKDAYREDDAFAEASGFTPRQHLFDELPRIIRHLQERGE